VHHDVRVFADTDLLAAGAAEFVAELARRRIETSGEFTFAVSGGRTPQRFFEELDSRDVPWERAVIYQVDERIAAPGDPGRNLTCLSLGLTKAVPSIVPMPVDEADLDAAADRYGAQLPAHLDLVHLGLGVDGHTASLVPGDAALGVTDRLVTVTEEYEGYRRMTLTYGALARAGQLLWLVAGAAKRDPLAMLLHGDDSIPAGRVAADRSLVMADRAAL
jgi:6-phosphogluconolactonase